MSIRTNRRSRHLWFLAALCVISILLLCSCGNMAGDVYADKGTATTASETVKAETAQSTKEDKDGTSEAVTAAPADTSDTVGNGKTLIVYFSHTGTTREVAAYLHELVGGDIAELIPAVPYPEGYSDALDPAKREQREKARPAIKNTIDGIESYDVIYLGYPIWWGTVPMIINTFLESYDLSGKTIVPFATSGGTGISQSIQDIRAEIPSADVKDGLLVRSNDDIAPWLEKLGLI